MTGGGRRRRRAAGGRGHRLAVGGRLVALVAQAEPPHSALKVVGGAWIGWVWAVLSRDDMMAHVRPVPPQRLQILSFLLF